MTHPIRPFPNGGSAPLIPKPHNPLLRQCPQCAAEIPLVRFQVHGVCEAPACVQAKAMCAAQARAATDLPVGAPLRAELTERAGQALATLMQGEESDIDDLPMVAVPHQNTPLSPVSEERRALLAKSLDTHIAEAFETAEQDITLQYPLEEEEPDFPASDMACAMCQGQCCILGASHGFIKGEILQRQRLRQPGLTPEALKAYYMGQVPEVSTAGACIFQGERGCALPRRDRSRICNTHGCSGRKALESLEDDFPGRPIAVATYGKAGIAAIKLHGSKGEEAIWPGAGTPGQS
ncbi:hypothetical protein IV417_07045 [Alphaproteobacteria bacterium KMM 3653]|uniref:Uncharacterized protein n=1 Tax=Harenicola maris TaxID=2841044 RepID=A0AAP2CPA9_9RHOB|nr:hypothetical protein [Harenicola maris]